MVGKVWCGVDEKKTDIKTKDTLYCNAINKN